MSKKIVLASISLFMLIPAAYLHLKRLGRRYQPLHPGTFHPRHILVIRLDLIGDLVLSLVLVRLLKQTYPDAEIDLLAMSSSASVITDDPDIAEVFAYNPNVWRRPKALLQTKNWREARALRSRLRARKYDLAVSVFGPWAALIAAMSGARRVLGFAHESYPGLLTDSVPGQHWNEADHVHEVDYCLRLAQAAGASVSPDDRIPTLTVNVDAQEEAAELLQREGIDRNKPLIACHVSSNNGQSKRWPIPYWARLADCLIREDGCNLIFTGAPDDLPLIAAITQRMQEQTYYNLAGKTSLSQLAAVLQRADLLITGDSGPMHIAAAVGAPLIAIHGPTDPALSGPVSPHATILRDPIWCSPCYKAKGAPADCRFYTTQCMKNISPEQVRATVHEKLQQRNKFAQPDPTRRINEE
ncbi:MAG: lipopolysaccharide heptosyltransferase II, partial [Ktedonobacteraceae bacterium]|nr:lipopolysaccharide heptosyltransferase II [Ktedonobacteraceae bacterium]